jgi:hypothetical protein
MTKYVASWSEKDQPWVGGSWNPLPFDQARDTLAAQLERNLDKWSGYYSSEDEKAAYQRVLSILLEVQEPELRRGLSWSAGRHEFSITRADGQATG